MTIKKPHSKHQPIPLLHHGVRWVQRNKKVLAAGIAAVSISTPAMARDPFDHMLPDGGVFLGYRWGADQGGFEWGVEGGFNANVSDFYPIFGGTIQISVKNLSAPTLVAAFSGGSYPLHGEFGLAYRFGETKGFGLHVGVVGQLLFSGAVRYKFGLDDLSVDGGIRVPGSFWPLLYLSGGAHGRPLRTKDGFATGAKVQTSQSPETPSFFSKYDSTSIEKLWLHKAQAEWMSVPAFTQLANDLKHVGAPAQLVSKTLTAKDDEIRHAILAGGIASMASGKPLEIQEAKPRYRTPAKGTDGLIRLAIESWLDGCLHEGLAAQEVKVQAEQAKEEKVREALSQIASDESEHHELAWEIMGWAVQQKPKEVKEALRAVLETLPPHELKTLESDDEMVGLGSLSQSDRDSIYQRHIDSSRSRLSKLLNDG